jgi:hypothetical protein
MSESIIELLEDSRKLREELRTRREVLKRDLLESIATVAKVIWSDRRQRPSKLEVSRYSDSKRLA